MFSTKSKSEIEINPSATSTSLIGAGTTIKGDIVSHGDIRIDGILKGNIFGSAKVLIGAEGVWKEMLGSRQIFWEDNQVKLLLRIYSTFAGKL